MGKSQKIALAIFVVGVCCMCAKQSEGTEPSSQAGFNQFSPQTMVNVNRLYQENCSNCHGTRGAGGGAGTQTLLTKELFKQDHDKRFFDAIKFGVPEMGMSSYGETMSDAEIWALVVHIREMQYRALRAEFGSPTPVGDVYHSQRHKFKIETVLDVAPELRVPWSVDWLPDGRMLVTNRPGTMYVTKDGTIGPEVQNLPPVISFGQGGLMDVAVHPDYQNNGWIYLSFSDPVEDGRRASLTKVVRGKIKFSGDTATWTDQETIFEVDESFYTGSGIHFGSRIVFDGKGHIFFCIGERGQQDFAQDLTRPNGKVFRVNEDGSIPSDNPFIGGNNISAIWSYGHRNPQGLCFGLDGRLWDTEHAPRGGDELNEVVKGANYGWPLVCFGINYNDSPFVTPWPEPGQDIKMPIFRWLPSCAACGLDTMRGSAFPNWEGDLMAGGLAGQNVDRIRVKDGQFVEREEIIHGMGRVRDVVCGPDGYLYVVLNQPDKVIRLVPAD